MWRLPLVHSGAGASVVVVVVDDVIGGAGVEVQAMTPVDGWRAGAVVLVHPANISVMAIAAVAPTLRNTSYIPIPGEGHACLPQMFGKLSVLTRVGFAGRTKADLETARVSDSISNCPALATPVVSKPSCPVLVIQKTTDVSNPRHQRRRPSTVRYDKERGGWPGLMFPAVHIG
jgi:hypothetical protein